MHSSRALTITPRPSVEHFVRSVVRAEAARGGTGSAPHVAQRVMVRLHRQLENLVGPAAFDVVFARALVLARRSHPSIAGVEAGPGGTLTGLHGAALDDEREDAATAIVSHFMELLVTLVGEEFAMRLVGDLQPPANEEDGHQ